MLSAFWDILFLLLPNVEINTNLDLQALLDDYLKLLIEDVPNQDVHIGAVALAQNQHQRHGFWRYFQANFDTIKAKL